MARYLHPELVDHIEEMLAGIKEAIVEANRDAPRHTAVGGELQTISVAGSTYRFTLAENDVSSPFGQRARDAGSALTGKLLKRHYPPPSSSGQSYPRGFEGVRGPRRQSS